MPRIPPSFPPDFDEWRPGNPWLGEPPLPRWTFNPFTPEQMAELKTTYGRWAAGRTLGMISPAETFETAKRIAEGMYQGYKARALAWAPPTPAKVRAPRERKPKIPTPAEELAPLVGVLTPEIKESLIEDLQESWAIERKLPRRTEEKIKASRLVVDWAEERGVIIPGGKATEIVDEAIARLAPARA